MESSTSFRPDLRRYWIAGITVVLAISAALLLRPWVGESVPPIVLAPWILIGAWYGGLWVGLLSTALNSIAAAYFLVPPIHSFRIAERDDGLHLATLALLGVLISWLCESAAGSLFDWRARSWMRNICAPIPGTVRAGLRMPTAI